MKLKTLGSLALEGSTLQRPKPLLLLAYLGLEGDTTRRVLAEMFFAHAKNPRDSLSTALRHLRHESAGLMNVEGDIVGSRIPCDAADLMRRFDEGQAEDALTLYDGSFLKGLDLELGPELEEWIFGTREAIARRVQDAYLRVAESKAARGEFSWAAREAETAYFLPGAPEPSPEVLQRTYALLLAGESSHTEDVRKEAESFEVPVLGSRDEALSGLREEASISRDDAESSRSNLSPAESPFVGRDLELSEAGSLIHRNEVRLLSLIGPGGVGKSRLAMEIARMQLKEDRFQDGVYFVRLESTADPRYVASLIAEAVSLPLQGTEPPRDQVTRYIGEKQMLLALDNYEQLVEDASALSELLASCRNLKLLITSRERLNIQDEWLFPVEGLAYPDSAQPLAEARHYEALQLFRLRAKQHQRTFGLTSENLPGVLKICRLVEGMPLGLELAAAWVRHMPVAEIADEISGNLDVLGASMRGAPERHASLRATFEHSWQLLSERERQVLRGLSVFSGGFRREAAAAVVGATLPVLAKLVDKSLLRVSAEGRYDRHPLLYQCMQEKLAEHSAERAEYRSLHSRYFMELLGNQDDALVGGQKIREAADLIEAELPNIRNAWTFAID